MRELLQQKNFTLVMRSTKEGEHTPKHFSWDGFLGPLERFCACQGWQVEVWRYR